MKQAIASVALAILAMGSVGVSAREETARLPNESVTAVFPAHWTEMLSRAYADFRTIRSDVSCFNAEVRKIGAIYRVAFVPPDEVRVEGDRVTAPVSPGNSSCGHGWYYEFDNAGTLIKKAGLR